MSFRTILHFYVLTAPAGGTETKCQCPFGRFSISTVRGLPRLTDRHECVNVLSDDSPFLLFLLTVYSERVVSMSFRTILHFYYDVNVRRVQLGCVNVLSDDSPFLHR